MKKLMTMIAACALACAAWAHNGCELVTMHMLYTYRGCYGRVYFGYETPDILGIFCGDECVASTKTFAANVYMTFVREPMREYVWKSTFTNAWGERWTDEFGNYQWTLRGSTYAVKITPDMPSDKTIWPDWDDLTDVGHYIFYNDAWREKIDGKWYVMTEPPWEFIARIKAEYVVSDRMKRLIREHSPKRGTMFTLH